MIAFFVLLLEMSLLAFINLFGPIDVGNVVSSVMIFSFSFVYLICVHNDRTKENYSTPLILGYLLRLVILFFDILGNHIFVLPQSGSDSSMFYRASTEIVYYGKSNRSGFFITIMSSVFRIIGTNRLFGQFLLMLLSVLAIEIVLRTIDNLQIEEKDKRASAWIICLLPNFALLSSLFLRESIVTFLLTICVCAMVQWMKHKGSMYFLLSILFSIVACLFHSGCIGVTIGCIICLSIYDNRDQHIRISFWRLVLTIIIAFIASFVFLRYGDLLLGKYNGKLDNIESLSNTSEYGGSSYARFVGNSNNPFNMILYTIPRIVYFLFSPFPWQWRGIGDIIAFFFSGLFYLLTIRQSIRYLIKGYSKNRSAIICLLVIAFICTFIFSWGTSNTGTASRHRDKMVLLYGIIYSLSNIPRKSTECNEKGKCLYTSKFIR